MEDTKTKQDARDTRELGETELEKISGGADPFEPNIAFEPNITTRKAGGA